MFCVFFFNDTATTEIYTLSLHDALPIWAVEVRDGIGHRLESRVRAQRVQPRHHRLRVLAQDDPEQQLVANEDRKSTRLNSSHANISYAVFCLKKKKTINTNS